MIISTLCRSDEEGGFPEGNASEGTTGPTCGFQVSVTPNHHKVTLFIIQLLQPSINPNEAAGLCSNEPKNCFTQSDKLATTSPFMLYFY